MADYGLGSTNGYGEGGLGLGSTGSSTGEGLSGPTGGFFGGGNPPSGGNGGGLSATPDDLFSYNPTFYGGYNPNTSYSLGDLYSQDSGTGFGMTGSEGLKAPTNPYGDTGKGLGGQEGDEDFWSSGWGKFLKGVGRFAVATNPIGRLGLMGYDAYSAAQSGNYGQAVGGFLGAATGNGLLGTAAGIATDATMGKPVAGRVGGTLGSAVGGGIAGPVGAMAGGYLGSRAASGTGATGPSNAPRGDGSSYQDRVMPTTSQSFGAKDWAGTLAGLYSANQAQQAARGNTLDLSSMYGPNSAYAGQLRQQLERRDAAGGRRSQYGPREVELQAQLAKMMATAGPGIQNQNLQAEQRRSAARNNSLNLLLNAGSRSGLFDRGAAYLGDMFSGNSNTNQQPLYFDSNTSGDVYSV